MNRLEVRSDHLFFKDFALVMISRLFVMPVSEAQWKRVLDSSDRKSMIGD